MVRSHDRKPSLFCAAAELMKCYTGRQRWDGTFSASEPLCGNHTVSTDDGYLSFVDDSINDLCVSQPSTIDSIIELNNRWSVFVLVSFASVGDEPKEEPYSH